ncbi:MAG TPA: LPS export ABC transporter periplasmic protein LptC [Burkholderiaceae bacterium]|jgi:lipopolysaccharide export system protein LptC|nr:LPS export ABC transporter periplasmic protein LptC [Burkholderiaceae bacterium]
MRKRHYDQLAAALSIVLLAALAASSYYLAELSERFPRATGERKVTHDPDYFVERFSLTRVNERGEPTFRMSAQRLLHFPDDDTSEFAKPVLISLDPAKPRVTVTAERGQAGSKGQETHLYDNVVLTRAAESGKPPLRITTEYVLLLPEEDVARTDRAVRIAYGESVLTGVGMEFNNAARTLDVHSRVQSRWVGSQAPNSSPSR